MTVSDSEPGEGGGLEDPVTDQPLLCGRVVTFDDGTEECTIYPEEALTAGLTERWVAAEGDAFVDLPTIR